MSSNEKRVLRANNEKRPTVSANNKSSSNSKISHYLIAHTTAAASAAVKTHSDKSIECNLTDEMSAEDEELILKHVNMSAEDLKLQKENKDLFWQKVAESVRGQLSETLEDNQQVSYSFLLKIKY